MRNYETVSLIFKSFPDRKAVSGSGLGRREAGSGSGLGNRRASLDERCAACGGGILGMPTLL